MGIKVFFLRGFNGVELFNVLIFIFKYDKFFWRGRGVIFKIKCGVKIFVG